MIEDDSLSLVARDGTDDSLPIGAAQDQVAARVSDSGEAVLIVDRADPLLAERNADQAIASLAAVPIIYDDCLVGMIECVNRLDGAPFDEDDVFLLATIAESAAGALHNASLLEAEKKVEILETLVEISNEITSTLNLERVLQVVVNSPQRIMSYERAAVALEERGKLQVKAVSGVTEIVHSDATIVKLRDMLEFCAVSDTAVSAIGRPEAIEAERPEDRARFREYFTASGMRSWFSVPLSDDQGKLGILVFESSDPDAFGEAQTEFVKIVAGQATVAVRNASLYQEVPLIGMLEPLLKKKHDFMRLDTRRRTAYIVLAAAAVLFLAFVPLPMRVQGNATVAPQTSSKIQAEVDGVVRNVYVHEGDRVAKGTVLADLNDWDYRAELAAAQAKLGQAEAAVNRALAGNDGMEAGIQRNEANYWAAEVKRAEERLDHTRLRSPIQGVVSTPHIENLVGKKLDAGDTFGEVLNADHATIDVEVDQDDVRLVQDGDPAAVKLDSFPTARFNGGVELVSPRSDAVGDQRVFFARIDVANPDGLIRPGMQGISKISTGWRPAGYVLFRGVAMWGWAKLWSWFGW
jgi:RND family efflux transporter MFP subunit